MFVVTKTTNTVTISSIPSTKCYISSTTENSTSITYSVLRSTSSVDSITNVAGRFVIRAQFSYLHNVAELHIVSRYNYLVN